MGLISAIMGLFVLITGKNASDNSNLFGDFLAFATSIFYAVFLLIICKIRNRVSSIQVMYYSSYGAIVVLFITSLIKDGFLYPQTWQVLLPILGLAIFSQILGQGGLSYILGKISANTASVLVLSQPICDFRHLCLFDFQ